MGDTEIGDFDMVTVFCPEQVGRFDVTVDDSLVVYYV
jgi:hypothetical protein